MKSKPITEQEWPAGNEPLVSISCITYNHCKFIRDAIEGFLMQKTDFHVEILIHDDASTDGTDDIIREYEKKYPEIIKPIYQTENQYKQGRFISATYQYPRIRGKYIALCEGDDYWTDPLKLQKQVDFLEENVDYSFVFTPARLQNELNEPSEKFRNKYSKKIIRNIDLYWVLKKGGAFYPTASVLFRKKILDTNLKTWFGIHSTGDYPIAILAVLTGKIGYIESVSCIYRKHLSSTTHSLYSSKDCCEKKTDEKYNRHLQFIDFLAKELNLSEKIIRSLKAKEKYIRVSKYIDCNIYKKSIILANTDFLHVKYLFRFWIKFFYVIFIRKCKPKRLATN